MLYRCQRAGDPVPCASERIGDAVLNRGQRAGDPVPCASERTGDAVLNRGQRAGDSVPCRRECVRDCRSNLIEDRTNHRDDRVPRPHQVCVDPIDDGLQPIGCALPVALDQRGNGLHNPADNLHESADLLADPVEHVERNNLDVIAVGLPEFLNL